MDSAGAGGQLQSEPDRGRVMRRGIAVSAFCYMIRLGWLQTMTKQPNGGFCTSLH